MEEEEGGVEVLPAKGVASDRQWRGLGVRVFLLDLFFSFFPKETGLAGYLSTNGLGPLGLFGRGDLGGIK